MTCSPQVPHTNADAALQQQMVPASKFMLAQATAYPVGSCCTVQRYCVKAITPAGLAKCVVLACQVLAAVLGHQSTPCQAQYCLCQPGTRLLRRFQNRDQSNDT